MSARLAPLTLAIGLGFAVAALAAVADDALFDDAISEIYHRQLELRRLDQAQRLA